MCFFENCISQNIWGVYPLISSPQKWSTKIFPWPGDVGGPWGRGGPWGWYRIGWDGRGWYRMGTGWDGTGWGRDGMGWDVTTGRDRSLSLQLASFPSVSFFPFSKLLSL